MTYVSKLKFVRYLWKFCNFFVLRLLKLFAFLYAALARGRSGHPCPIHWALHGARGLTILDDET